MRIGIPREIKTMEGRVGLIPRICADLVADGHEVLLESGAGLLSGYSDEDYRRAGVSVVPDAGTLYDAAGMIVKIKEPQEGDLDHLRADHLLFCFLHLAPLPELTRRLLDIGLTAVAFETVEEGGRLPLLAPMSAIAGMVSVQVGATLLHAPQGGKGLLLGGLDGAMPGRVVVLGAGNAGLHAAKLAAALGAEVSVFELRADRREAAAALGENIRAFEPEPGQLAQAVAQTDLLVGAVLVTGARAPRVVDREMVAAMAPGSVVADIAVDQGGCIATTRPTSWAEPSYVEEGVVHFAVTNMPGAVPRTASQAMSSALAPYVAALARPGWRDASPALAAGVNVADGELVHPALRG